MTSFPLCSVRLLCWISVQFTYSHSTNIYVWHIWGGHGHQNRMMLIWLFGYIYKNFSKKALCLKLPVGMAQIRWKLHEPSLKVKKSYSIYRVHGTQNDRFELTISMQNTVLKNMHRIMRWRSKWIKIWLTKTKPSNRFLCWNHELKLVVLSTMNPINFFLPIKGANAILNELGLFPQAVSDQVPFVKSAYI